MDYKNINYVYLINEYKSISKAATMIGLSRQSLTTRLKELEIELGFQLFTRTTNGVTPTPRGEIFLNDAKLIIESFQSLKNDFEGSKDYYIASTYNPYCIECIYTIFPKFNINMSNVRYINSSSENIISGIINESIDLGIIGVTDFEYEYLIKKYNLENKKIELITEDKLCIQVMKSSKLYNKDYIEVEDLKNLTYLKLKSLFSKNNYDYKEEFRILNLNQYNCIYVNNYQELLQLLPNEKRFSTSSYINKYHLDKYGIKCIPFKNPDIKIKHFIIYRSDSNEDIQGFADILTNYIKDMTKEA